MAGGVSSSIVTSTMTKLVSSTQRLLADVDHMSAGKAVYMLVDLSLRTGFLIGVATASGDTNSISQLDHIYEYVRIAERKLLERLR